MAKITNTLLVFMILAAALGQQVAKQKWLTTILPDMDSTITVSLSCRVIYSGKPTWARVGATYSTLGVEVEVLSSTCHPQYHPGHDIALVKLKQRLNSSFIPACLDTEGAVAGTKGLGVGRPIGSAYVQLRDKCPVKSWLEVKPASECEETFPGQNINAEATLCTKDPANGPGDCLSGPLYLSKERCVLTVTGIASFGKACFDETANGRTPSVYTKVAYYIPWIESIAWPSSSS